MTLIQRLSSLVLLLGFVSGLSAQTTNGTITGTITDATGAAAPGVQIQVANQDTGEQRTATTQDNGTYIVPQLPPGRYTVTVAKQGFATEARTNVQLLVNQSVALDFKMS